MEDALKGQFYEFFCYNELIQNDENIKIVKANYAERKVNGNFIHSNEGKIIFSSRGIAIAEFDVLGIKNNTLYWWEITRSKKLDSKGVKGLKKKLALLDKVFEKYEKLFCLIIPFEIEGELPFKYKIIPEPDYDEFFNNGYFKFNKKIKNCISLTEFEKKSSNYDYIDDIIAYSHDYFDNKNYDVLEVLQNILLVERLYDINEIKKSRFRYFDVKNYTSGFIEIINNQIYMNGVSLQSKRQEKIVCEIFTLLKRLEYVIQ